MAFVSSVQAWELKPSGLWAQPTEGRDLSLKDTGQQSQVFTGLSHLGTSAVQLAKRACPVPQGQLS